MLSRKEVFNHPDFGIHGVALSDLSEKGSIEVKDVLSRIKKLLSVDGESKIIEYDPLITFKQVESILSQLPDDIAGDIEKICEDIKDTFVYMHRMFQAEGNPKKIKEIFFELIGVRDFKIQIQEYYWFLLRILSTSGVKLTFDEAKKVFELGNGLPYDKKYVKKILSLLENGTLGIEEANFILDNLGNNYITCDKIMNTFLWKISQYSLDAETFLRIFQHIDYGVTLGKKNVGYQLCLLLERGERGILDEKQFTFLLEKVSMLFQSIPDVKILKICNHLLRLAQRRWDSGSYQIKGALNQKNMEMMLKIMDLADFHSNKDIFTTLSFDNFTTALQQEVVDRKFFFEIVERFSKKVDTLDIRQFDRFRLSFQKLFFALQEECMGIEDMKEVLKLSGQLKVGDWKSAVLFRFLLSGKKGVVKNENGFVFIESVIEMYPYLIFGETMNYNSVRENIFGQILRLIQVSSLSSKNAVFLLDFISQGDKWDEGRTVTFLRRLNKSQDDNTVFYKLVDLVDSSVWDDEGIFELLLKKVNNEEGENQIISYIEEKGEKVMVAE